MQLILHLQEQTRWNTLKLQSILDCLFYLFIYLLILQFYQGKICRAAATPANIDLISPLGDPESALIINAGDLLKPFKQ